MTQGFSVDRRDAVLGLAGAITGLAALPSLAAAGANMPVRELR